MQRICRLCYDGLTGSSSRVRVLWIFTVNFDWWLLVQEGAVELFQVSDAVSIVKV